jgi:hypothetical protein
MERFTRPLMASTGADHHRQGWLRSDSLKAFATWEGSILAIIGGTAALETTWIEAIEDVDLDDLNPNRCGNSASRASARCSSPWTATAEPLCRESGASRAAGGGRQSSAGQARDA